MNENENQVLDAVSEDWDDMDFSDLADTEIEPGTEAPAADQQVEQEVQEPAEQEHTAPAQQEADQSFQLKHMDEVRTVGREEVIALAQKGLDYDRIRGKLEQRDGEDQEAAALIRAMAEKAGMGLSDFLDATAAAQRCKPDRSDYDAVLAQVKLERKERGISAREDALNAAQQQEQERRQAAERRQADIQSFLRSFPDVKADTIPQAVWAEVAKGRSLTEAYAVYQAEQLRRELETERQNAKNAARSAGSRATAGASDMDEFDRLWYDD